MELPDLACENCLWGPGLSSGLKWGSRLSLMSRVCGSAGHWMGRAAPQGPSASYTGVWATPRAHLGPYLPWGGIEWQVLFGIRGQGWDSGWEEGGIGLGRKTSAPRQALAGGTVPTATVLRAAGWAFEVGAGV